MPKIVTKIFSERHIVPIWEQQLRVAAYCCVSTKHEEQQRSLETQSTYYSNYIRNNPNWELVDVYFDTTSGVHTHNHPGYQRLMRDCAKQKVNLILVKSLSRFGRDALETIHQIRRLKEDERWGLH